MPSRWLESTKVPIENSRMDGDLGKADGENWFARSGEGNVIFCGWGARMVLFFSLSFRKVGRFLWCEKRRQITHVSVKDGVCGNIRTTACARIHSRSRIKISRWLETKMSMRNLAGLGEEVQEKSSNGATQGMPCQVSGLSVQWDSAGKCLF